MGYFDGARWHRPTGSAQGPIATLPATVVWVALAVLVGSLLVGAIAGAAVAEIGPRWLAIAVSAGVGYGPSVWWARRVARRAGGWSSIGAGAQWSDVGWGPLTWLGAIGVQFVLVAIVVVTGVPIESNTTGLDGADSTLPGRIALVVLAVGIAPVVEELVFRGVVLRGLLGVLPAWAAVGAQGMLFGVAHLQPGIGMGNVGLSIVLAGVGTAFGASAVWTRRLAAPVLAHMIFNAVVIALLLSGVADDLGERPPYGVLCALVS